MTEAFAGVYLLDAPFAIDRIYDYLIPHAYLDVVRRGSFVTVPFGNGNRKHLALVAEVRERSEYEKVKPLYGVSTDRIALSEEMMGLCLFMKEQTLCTVGDAVRAMVPASALSRMTEIYLPREGVGSIDAGYPEDAAIVDYIRAHAGVSTAQLRRVFGSTVDEVLRRLRERRAVIRDAQYHDVDAASYATSRRIALSHEQAQSLLDGHSVGGITLRSDKQRAVLRTLLESDGAVEDGALCSIVGCTASVLTALTAKGVLREVRTPKFRRPFSMDAATQKPPRPIELNEQQRAAYTTLCDFADSDQPHAALLHGVTGSGKTCVMLSLISHLLGSGKGAIVLLPEIALTPQSIAIFCSHFGERVAVIHSGLSAGERYDAYTRIKNGDCSVVVGTRSAVFAPVKNLGVIIIDEEQEHTYKSDSNPKYRSHDVARYRCAANGALMLLCSATPSLESYYKAMQGKYTLLRLTERYGNAVLPQVIIADTRREIHSGNSSPLGTRLCEELVQNVAKGEQSILFLNRRGYHRFVSCRSCGQAITCPHCSVAMTYHTRRGSFSEGELICHCCGTRRPLPRVCPDCGSEHLAHNGYGTQRVEQELSQLLPNTKILRMDTDTTTTKHAYDDMLGQFRAHRADVLLGTQMVTKGHDFPDVTLVGVLSADSSLYVDDYRAAERTFALLTQVIGRAGRRETHGRAVIQTANPDHEVIRLACAQDYETFYRREIGLRQMLVFPPFCDIALLTLSCKDEKALMLASRRLYEEVSRLMKEDFSDVKLIVFGPFEAPVYRAENKFRMRMVFKCGLNPRSRALFATLLRAFGGKGTNGVQLSVDFNPSSL